MEGLSCKFCLLLFSAVFFSKVNTLESLYNCAGAGATPKLIMYKLWMSCQKTHKSTHGSPMSTQRKTASKLVSRNPQSLDLALLPCSNDLYCDCFSLKYEFHRSLQCNS